MDHLKVIKCPIHQDRDIEFIYTNSVGEDDLVLKCSKCVIEQNIKKSYLVLFEEFFSEDVEIEDDDSHILMIKNWPPGIHEYLKETIQYVQNNNQKYIIEEKILDFLNSFEKKIMESIMESRKRLLSEVENMKIDSVSTGQIIKEITQKEEIYSMMKSSQGGFNNLNILVKEIITTSRQNAEQNNQKLKSLLLDLRTQQKQFTVDIIEKSMQYSLLFVNNLSLTPNLSQDQYCYKEIIQNIQRRSSIENTLNKLKDEISIQYNDQLDILSKKYEQKNNLYNQKELLQNFEIENKKSLLEINSRAQTINQYLSDSDDIFSRKIVCEEFEDYSTEQISLYLKQRIQQNNKKQTPIDMKLINRNPQNLSIYQYPLNSLKVVAKGDGLIVSSNPLSRNKHYLFRLKFNKPLYQMQSIQFGLILKNQFEHIKDTLSTGCYVGSNSANNVKVTQGVHFSNIRDNSIQEIEMRVHLYNQDCYFQDYPKYLNTTRDSYQDNEQRNYSYHYSQKQGFCNFNNWYFFVNFEGYLHKEIIIQSIESDYKFEEQRS